MHRPLPASGAVSGRYKILSVEDKGTEKGAILKIEKRLTDSESGELLYTVIQTIFLRGDGGQGGFGTVDETPSALPEAAPDLVVEIPTMPQIALIRSEEHTSELQSLMRTSYPVF